MIKVTDYNDILKYNILSTPGLVINEKVVSSGRIPSPAEVTTFLTSALASRMKKRVLFLCTGNSARSQMAEAIVNARLGEIWEAYSAGTKPAGFVHPTALAVLDQIGIHHNGRSKSVEEFQGDAFRPGYHRL